MFIPSHTSLVGKLIRLPLKLLPEDKVVPILGGRLRGKRWIAGAGAHSYWLGIFERKKRILFEKTVKEGDIVFDIGAHVGFYSLLASVLVGEKGKVFAFEPLPRNIWYLKQHILINGVKNVEIMEMAVTDRRGEVFLDDTLRHDIVRVSPDGGLKVKSETLDELVVSGKVPSPKVIKIDVEGAEVSVLVGGKNTLLQFMPTLFLSTHSSEIHRECIEFCRSLGYSIVPINGKNVENSDELFIYRNRYYGF